MESEDKSVLVSQKLLEALGYVERQPDINEYNIKAKTYKSSSLARHRHTAKLKRLFAIIKLVTVKPTRSSNHGLDYNSKWW